MIKGKAALKRKLASVQKQRASIHKRRLKLDNREAKVRMMLGKIESLQFKMAEAYNSLVYHETVIRESLGQ